MKTVEDASRKSDLQTQSSVTRAAPNSIPSETQVLRETAHDEDENFKRSERNKGHEVCHHQSTVTQGTGNRPGRDLSHTTPSKIEA
jgi:hypothetical protein